MCLILYANTADAAASITPDHIRDAWSGNPDGMGFAFRRGPTDRVEVRKGFMQPRHAIQALQRIQALAPQELCVHWRYGTSGGVTPANTHPFAMDHGALIHNGILSIPGTLRESDTRVAARLLYPLKPKDLEEVLETWRNGSRLLFMAHKKSQSWRTGGWYKTQLKDVIMSQTYSLPELVVRVPVSQPSLVFPPKIDEEFDDWYARRVAMGRTPSRQEETDRLLGPVNTYRSGRPGSILRLPVPPALPPLPVTPITPPSEDVPTVGDMLKSKATCGDYMPPDDTSTGTEG